MSGDSEQPGAKDQSRYTKRDSETQIVLGTFVTVISIPVLAGTFWADTVRAMVVNVVAGLVLFCIGVGMAVFGWKRRPL